MDAAYVFQVRFRLVPDGARVTPASFETTMEIPASEPGEENWRFFRDHLWRGEIGDEKHMRSVAEDRLGVPVEHVSFSELRTDESYLEALTKEIAEDLPAYKAESADDVLHKYLGSSIHVRE